MALADAMHCVRPGVWHWTAPHPDWTPWDPVAKTGFGWSQKVGCVCYETPDQLVLIDPLAPPSCTPDHRQFWQALDDSVQQRQQPVAVLLSTDWHDRSAQAVFNRYSQQFGASIWVHEAAPRDSLDCQPTHTFCEGGQFAGSVQAYFLKTPHPEVFFYLPSVRTLVIADALWGSSDGRLWIGSHEFCSDLPRLLEEFQIDRLLLSHAEPILSNAQAVLAAVARERPEWADEDSPQA